MRTWHVLLAIAFAPGAYAADPEAGLQLAQESCAFCHVVEEGGMGMGTDAVPSFAAIAQEAGDDITALRSFTVDPHPQMPQFADLSEQQVQNLIAYFRLLQD